MLFGAHGGGEDFGVPPRHHNGAVGLAGDEARLQVQRLTADFHVQRVDVKIMVEIFHD